MEWGGNAPAYYGWSGAGAALYDCKPTESLFPCQYPGEKAVPMSEASQTVYEALGADIGIRKAVDDFYARVVADPQLQPFFADVDMTTLRRHQVDMLVAATGGPRQYDGRDMAAAHAGKGITSAAFGRVVGHLVATLESLGVDGQTVDSVVATLAPLESSIVTA